MWPDLLRKNKKIQKMQKTRCSKYIVLFYKKRIYKKQTQEKIQTNTKSKINFLYFFISSMYLFCRVLYCFCIFVFLLICIFCIFPKNRNKIQKQKLRIKKMQKKTIQKVSTITRLLDPRGIMKIKQQFKSTEVLNSSR